VSVLHVAHSYFLMSSA